MAQMAQVSDIDTKSAVKKFLRSSLVVSPNDETSDSLEEIIAVLENIALSLLLFPQAALALVLRAKNVLQQLVKAELDVLGFILSAIEDLNNSSAPVIDISHIVEARTALLEIDKLGTVQASSLNKFNSTIQKFLDRTLADLKRNRRGELERSGLEARQDILNALGSLSIIHTSVIGRLKDLSNSVSDFQSVDLVRLVSAKTTTRVRTSLRQVQRGIEKNNLSKTSMAIELLAGSAALQSISKTKGVYDLVVQTNLFPDKRNITISAEQVSARTFTSNGSWDASGVGAWNFEMAIDREEDGDENPLVTKEFPRTGASHRVFIKTTGPGSQTYDVPADGKLFIRVDDDEIIVPFNTGINPISDIISAINSFVNFTGDKAICYEYPSTGGGRLIIVGEPGKQKISILPSQGALNGSDEFESSGNSIHASLGFSDFQNSSKLDIISPSELADFINDFYPLTTATVVGNTVEISSNLNGSFSFLRFSGDFSGVFNLAGSFESVPTFMVLVENGEEIDPKSIGVFEGSLITALENISKSPRQLDSKILKIIGNQLIFEQALPREENLSVTAEAAIVNIVKDLIVKLSKLPTFDNDIQKIQQIASPLLSTASLAQINDAKKVFIDIQNRLQTLHTTLNNAQISPDRVQFQGIADNIVRSLEERGLDRALDILNRGKFSQFFALNSELTSKGGRFLKAIEEVGRTDLQSPTTESSQRSTDLVFGSSPDVLPGKQQTSDREIE